LALSILALLIFGVGVPFVVTYKISSAQWDYDRAIEHDYESGLCRNYIEVDLAELVEPKYQNEGGSCWHIYTSRFFDIRWFGDIRPYTIEVYRENKATQKRLVFLMTAGLMSLLCVIVSGLVYALGLVVAW